MSHSNVLAMMSTLNAQGQRPVVTEGIILAGSYDATTGTVQVIMGHTVAAATFQHPNGQQITPTVVGASLQVTGYGDQYGPIGGERCLLVQCGTQFTAFLEFDQDDSPGAPSGERWIVHRSPINPQNITGYTKWTNDGATGGDGLGGWQTLGGNYASLATTGGITFVLNDTANTATITGSNGLQISINKATGTINIGGGSTNLVNVSGGSSSIAVGSSGVIFNGVSASSANGIVRQSDLAAFLTQLNSALAIWASSNLQGGSGASGPGLSFTPSASSHSFTN